MVGWAADFPWSVPGSALLDWQQVLFAAGERHRIFRVEQAQFLDFRRDRDGDIGAFLLAHPERVPRQDERLPPGFLPEALGSRPGGEAVTRTLLEYLDAAGALRSAWIGELTEAYPAIPLPRYFPYRAVQILADTFPPDWAELDRLRVSVSSSVDIWFPWTRQLFQYPAADRVDNRRLSRLNGGRLNAFLAELADATRAAGGEWTMTSPPAHYPRADGSGVLLDAAPPA